MTKDDAKGSPIFTLADWLRLHEVSAAVLADWIPEAAPTQRPADPPLSTPATPQIVIMAIAQALPQLSVHVDRIIHDVHFDLAPDTKRFPRAFTLNDMGDGKPFVSCPCTGRTSDLLLLAHEIGHALQALAASDAPFPPIQRELAAFIAEDAAGRAFASSHPAIGALLRARQARAAHHAPALRAALSSAETGYAYSWNYPVARVVAKHAAKLFSPDELANLITAPGSLGPLLARLS